MEKCYSQTSSLVVYQTKKLSASAGAADNIQEYEYVVRDPATRKSRLVRLFRRPEQDGQTMNNSVEARTLAQFLARLSLLYMYEAPRLVYASETATYNRIFNLAAPSFIFGLTGFFVLSRSSTILPFAQERDVSDETQVALYTEIFGLFIVLLAACCLQAPLKSIIFANVVERRVSEIRTDYWWARWEYSLILVGAVVLLFVFTVSSLLYPVKSPELEVNVTLFDRPLGKSIFTALVAFGVVWVVLGCCFWCQYLNLQKQRRRRKEKAYRENLKLLPAKAEFDFDDYVLFEYLEECRMFGSVATRIEEGTLLGERNFEIEDREVASLDVTFVSRRDNLDPEDFAVRIQLGWTGGFLSEETIKAEFRGMGTAIEQSSHVVNHRKWWQSQSKVEGQSKGKETNEDKIKNDVSEIWLEFYGSVFTLDNSKAMNWQRVLRNKPVAVGDTVDVEGENTTGSVRQRAHDMNESVEKQLFDALSGKKSNGIPDSFTGSGTVVEDVEGEDVEVSVEGVEL